MLSKRQIKQLAAGLDNPALVKRLFKDHEARQSKSKECTCQLIRELPCGGTIYLRDSRTGDTWTSPCACTRCRQ